MKDEGRVPAALVVAFAVLGAGLLLTVGAAFLDEYHAEWREWRRRFEALPQNAGHAPLEPGIQQIWLPRLGRVDRCTSCHLGGDDPVLAGLPEPFRAHADGWLASHPPERFGCTVCHGGQGAATTFVGAAHDPIPHWRDPMRSLAFMGARCGRCHRERRPPRAPLLATGRALIAESNCAGCHEIPGFSTADVRAPQLDGLADKLQEGWLRRWLRDPKAYLSASRMPEFRLSPREVEDLVAFLRAQPGPAVPATRVDWSRADPERGATVFRVARCVTCHALDGRGGGIGPELTRVGSKVTRAWLLAWLEDPSRYQPATLMPRFRFEKQDLLDLVAYLSSELVDGKEPPADTPPTPPGSVEAGRETFVRRGCHGCHGVSALPDSPRIGPSLGDLATRPLDAARLQDKGIAATLPNWVYTKLREPETLASDARMPTFGFSQSAAADVTLAVLSATDGSPPAGWTTDDSPVVAYQPQGEFGALVRRFRCLSCHNVRGYGGTLSTVAFDRIGSQLQRSYIETYLQNPIAVRVGIAARMPRLGINAAEARTLAERLSSVFVDDSLERTVPHDAALVGEGRRLYERLGCQGCHIIGAQGGYVGPDLTDSGRRLQPGWIVAWLREPERWKPGTLQPDYGLSEAAAEALAAYTMSLRKPLEPKR